MNGRKIILVVAGVLLLVSSATAGGQLDQGIRKYNDLDLDGALEIFHQVANDESEVKEVRIEALKYVGLCHLAKGKEHYAQVKDVFHAILALDPKFKIEVDRTPKVMRDYYFQVTSEMGLFPPKEAPGIKTMAIIDFSAASVGEEEKGWSSMGEVLSTLLVTDLENISALRVVERERIDFLLEELELQSTDKVDQDTAVRVGKLVGAQSVCTGGLTRIEDKLRIDVRLVSVETGEVLLAEEMTGKTKEFFDLEKKLAENFAKKIDVEVTKAEMESMKQAKAEKLSYETLQLYSVGLDFLSQQKYAEARDAFEQVLEANPNMELAKAKLELAEVELQFASLN